MYKSYFSPKNILVFFSLIMIGVIFIQSCFTKKSDVAEYHSFITTSEFKSAARPKQIERCASCHQEIAQNEALGPHAAAYKSLTSHREFVNSEAYDCWFYTKRVNNTFEGCVGCHAPENLYETFLYDSLGNTTQFVEKILNIPHPSPTKRGVENRITGIDCLSCHYNGENILSLAHIPSADDADVKKQTLAKITENNLVCYPCHFDVAKSLTPQLAINRTGAAVCVNCHQEKNESGKPTHYFYWQHDSPEKTNPKIDWIMNDFSLTIKPTGKEATLTWKNTSIPHRISPGPELIIHCEVLNADSTILGAQKIWVNQKATFDKEMYEHHDNNNLPGTMGIDVPLDGNPIPYTFPIKSGKTATFYRLSVFHKSQYWFPDSLSTLAGQKVIRIGEY